MFYLWLILRKQNYERSLKAETVSLHTKPINDNNNLYCLHMVCTFRKSANSQPFPKFSYPHPQPKLHGFQGFSEANFPTFLFFSKYPNYAGHFPDQDIFCGFPTTLHKQITNLFQVGNGLHLIPNYFWLWLSTDYGPPREQNTWSTIVKGDWNVLLKVPFPIMM